MKKKLNIIIAIIILVIIIAGIVVTSIYGLNYDLIYSDNKQVTIYIGKSFDIKDIEAITKEVIGESKIIIQKVELYEDMVSITVKDITQEQISSLNEKINEKYELENTVEDEIIVSENAKITIKDLVKPYILTILISFILVIIYILIYMIVKYKTGKQVNIIKDLAKAIAIIILVQALYFSVIAIIRLPINRLTIPISLIIYIITTIVLMGGLEKKYN